MAPPQPSKVFVEPSFRPCNCALVSGSLGVEVPNVRKNEKSDRHPRLPRAVFLPRTTNASGARPYWDGSRWSIRGIRLSCVSQCLRSPSAWTRSARFEEQRCLALSTQCRPAGDQEWVAVLTDDPMRHPPTAAPCCTRYWVSILRLYLSMLLARPAAQNFAQTDVVLAHLLHDLNQCEPHFFLTGLAKCFSNAACSARSVVTSELIYAIVSILRSERCPPTSRAEILLGCRLNAASHRALSRPPCASERRIRHRNPQPRRQYRRPGPVASVRAWSNSRLSRPV